MRGVQQAWKAAEKVLKDNRVRRTPISVARIASRYATVVKRALEDDISGALIPLGENEWAILVNSQHHPNRQRFTIAHELGHLLLHGYRTPHADTQFRFRDARSSEGSVLEEIQANQFAAERGDNLVLVLAACCESLVAFMQTLLRLPGYLFDFILSARFFCLRRRKPVTLGWC